MRKCGVQNGKMWSATFDVAYLLFHLQNDKQIINAIIIGILTVVYRLWGTTLKMKF